MLLSKHEGRLLRAHTIHRVDLPSTHSITNHWFHAPTLALLPVSMSTADYSQPNYDHFGNFL
jgi:hypothetical protein